MTPTSTQGSGAPGNRTPITWVQAKCLPVRPASRFHQEVRPGIEPGLPPYHSGVLPKHLQTKVIPAGIEPALSCMSRRRLRRWTTGSSVTEAGVEPAKSPRSQRDRFASLRTRPCKKWRVRGSHPAVGTYEAPLGAGPPASCRSRYRAGLTGLMKASWAPAASAMPTCCRVAKARIELACPMDTTF